MEDPNNTNSTTESANSSTDQELPSSVSTTTYYQIASNLQNSTFDNDSTFNVQYFMSNYFDMMKTEDNRVPVEKLKILFSNARIIEFSFTDLLDKLKHQEKDTLSEEEFFAALKIIACLQQKGKFDPACLEDQFELDRPKFFAFRFLLPGDFQITKDEEVTLTNLFNKNKSEFNEVGQRKLKELLTKSMKRHLKNIANLVGYNGKLSRFIALMKLVGMSVTYNEFDQLDRLPGIIKNFIEDSEKRNENKSSIIEEEKRPESLSDLHKSKESLSKIEESTGKHSSEVKTVDNYRPKSKNSEETLSTEDTVSKREALGKMNDFIKKQEESMKIALQFTKEFELLTKKLREAEEKAEKMKKKLAEKDRELKQAEEEIESQKDRFKKVNNAKTKVMSLKLSRRNKGIESRKTRRGK